MLGPPNGGDELLDFDLAYCDSRAQILERHLAVGGSLKSALKE